MNYKPLLVLHQNYYNIFKKMSSPNKNLIISIFCQIVTPEQLTGDAVMAVVVTNDEIKPTNVMLDYYFPRRVENTICTYDNLTNTANVHKGGQIMKSNNYRQPRFVIWPAECELNTNATCVYRCKSFESLPYAFEKSLKWATLYNKGPLCSIRYVSIAVFDLDRTLVYSDELPNFGPMPNYEKVLQTARHHFNLVVLWSHGGTIHVHEQLSAIDFKFDLVLCLDENSKSTCKNLLHIYNHLPSNVRFTYAVLIDDSAYNWTPEYNCMIIPDRKLKTLNNLAIAIDRVCY